MATGRLDKATATRERLLVAARALFAERGFDDTSLRDVAAAADVAVGTVFVHFVDKADLLHAALFDDLERTLDAALVVPPGPLLHRLQHVGDAVFDYYERSPSLSRTLLRQSLFSTGPWAQKFAAQLGRVHGAVVMLTREAQATGEVRGDVDVMMFAIAFLSFFQFALTSWVTQAHPAPRAWLARLLRQHTDGVRSAASFPPDATHPRSTS